MYVFISNFIVFNNYKGLHPQYISRLMRYNWTANIHNRKEKRYMRKLVKPKYRKAMVSLYSVNAESQCCNIW